MRLSSRNVESFNVGYGNIGSGGQIGFADLHVSVLEKHYPNSIGAHAPSKLTFTLPQGMQDFSAYVALNDTSEDTAVADFFVYADNELVAVAHSVKPGQAPRLIEAEVYGAKQLHLVSSTPHWPGCHTLWIDPIVTRNEIDCVRGVLGEVEVTLGTSIEYCDTCIAVIVTDGYEAMAEAMLGSLWENGGCREASILILTDAGNTSCQHLATKFNAIVKYINRTPRDTYIIKSIAYSVARIIRANNYLVLDVDMIVTNSLNPLISSIGVMPSGHMMICREQENKLNNNILMGFESHPYFAKNTDLSKLKVEHNTAVHCPIFNGGVMVGSREAFLGLENAMRDLMPFSSYWEKQEVHTNHNVKVKWREQGVMNAALARTGKWSELSGIYNCQLAVSNNHFEIIQGAPTAVIDSQNATIIHFNGIIGREHYKTITHNYRDGVKKPFSTPNQNSTSEAVITGSKLFRSCYRNTASKAFSSIDSFWDYQGLWSVLWNFITDIKSPQVLDVNTIAMCTSAIAMRASESVIGNTEIITQNQPPEWFIAMAGQRLKIGDVELLMSENQDCGRKYDVIILDTSSNTRMLINTMHIAKNLLNAEGAIMLLDIQHPVNDINAILDKMRFDGWSDRLIFSHSDISLYQLRRNEQ